jgi:hypothetical protein
MVEKESKKIPEPYTTTDYLLTTTFWAAFVPGMLPTVPCLIYCCFYEPALIPLAVPVCLVILGSYYLFFCRAFRRFSYNLRTGNAPKNFILCILPFWLPLFYLLYLTFYALLNSELPQDPFIDLMTFSLGNVFYFGWITPLTIITYNYVGWYNPAYTNKMFFHIPIIICSVAFIVGVAGTVCVFVVSKKL